MIRASQRHGHPWRSVPDLRRTRADRPAVHHELGPCPRGRPASPACVGAGRTPGRAGPRRPARGAAGDSLELRLACLRLVVPEHAVVTDRTAAWLHGAPMVLEPHAHRQVPRVDLFLLPGGRLRRSVVRSGQRELLATEIEELGGLRVTTRLRTICDLGMKLPRRQAFAAMCSMMKVADFTRDDIRRQADVRFKGHRWVRQLRVLIPLCDPRFESPGECILALIWLDTPGLPAVRTAVAGQGPARLLLPGPRGPRPALRGRVRRRGVPRAGTAPGRPGTPRLAHRERWLALRDLRRRGRPWFRPDRLRATHARHRGRPSYVRRPTPSRHVTTRRDLGASFAPTRRVLRVCLRRLGGQWERRGTSSASRSWWSSNS